MTRKCLLARETKRKRLVEKYYKQREFLKKRRKDKNISIDERIKSQFQLSKLPRDSSKSRLTRRCSLTGRSRSVYRKFGISRIMFRSMALNGLLPGITKSSW